MAENMEIYEDFANWTVKMISYSSDIESPMVTSNFTIFECEVR